MVNALVAYVTTIFYFLGLVKRFSKVFLKQGYNVYTASGLAVVTVARFKAVRAAHIYACGCAILIQGRLTKQKPPGRLELGGFWSEFAGKSGDFGKAQR